MDVFVRGIPNNATRKQVEQFFATPFAECGIEAYHCDKFTGKNMANITVLNKSAALRFLDLYGVSSNAPPSARPKKGLSWDRKPIRCSRSREEATPISISAVAFAASEKARKAAQSTESQKYMQNAKVTRFAICSVQCGNWDYAANSLAFTSQFSVARQGTISFGLKEAVIVLGGEGSDQRRIHMNYHECRDVILGTYDDPAISFTLRCAPKFYEVHGEDAIANALLAMTLGQSTTKLKPDLKSRVTGINDAHSEVAGLCFVYRITLSNYTMISTVRGLLSRNVKAPSQISLSTPVINPIIKIGKNFTLLNYELTDQARFGLKPFSLLFQLERLARNAILLPEKVAQLLPMVNNIHEALGLEATLHALCRLNRSAPAAGPDTDASELTKPALNKLLQQFAALYDQFQYSPENPYELTKRYTHINLIHKLVVTPCCIFLDGPEPEPTNRVLRRYANHVDSFARVVFQDEDGGSVRYDPRASQDIIFHDRFKCALDKGITIAGKSFSFLGFSHSSLRSQSCWYMAPIFAEGSMKLPQHILKELGDFTNIRVPAKCAARTGQNFTDTNATVDLQPEMVGTLPMVQYGTYDFSDGVGTISRDLLRRIWQIYGRRRALKPTAIQIRFKGFKGMVSLDSRLFGLPFLLRDNMKKFEAPNAWNLEICGAGFKPLPMVLNRQFIKIFEDLGIKPEVLIDLQKAAVEVLRQITKDALNASKFLERMDCAKATRLPSLIKHLGDIGLDYRQDQFLYKVVEIAVVTNLRDIKYRGRIPIQEGVTLFGIMDETAELKEGEVFVVTESSPEGGRDVLVRDRVVVTRSPVLHPGDVQIAKAVNVSASSALQQLSNVVVFSQHGARDLPSQLSGGDLDGDLYNIVWDSRLTPSVTYQAAEYPRVTAVALDRDVTSKDMSDFFVTFMESDLLGMLCNVHMQLSDKSDLGTFDPACLKLAGMASTAVDFSKTGIPVEMKDCPKYDRIRPDFMAPSPRVIVSGQGHLDLEEEEDENEDDPALEGLDPERQPMRYYESPKVLGRLFRDIDERQFLAKMQQDMRTAALSSVTTPNLLKTLLSYVKRQAQQYGILYLHHKDLARDIRSGYEDSLLELLYYYEPSPSMPVSESEAFAGTILGRKTGSQGKPLRELSKTLRERFEAVAEYTNMRIVRGDEQMQGVTDLDLLYDESLDRELEALPRALACLAVAVEERGTVDRELGELGSFKYVAAAACMAELQRFRITTLGSYILPRA